MTNRKPKSKARPTGTTNAQPVPPMQPSAFLTPSSEAPNLRSGLSELLNDLNTLARNTSDAGEIDQLIKVIRVLSAILEEVLRQEIDKATPKYTDALGELNTAVASAKAAVKDIQKTAKAIKQAVTAAKAIDKVIGLIAKFLP